MRRRLATWYIWSLYVFAAFGLFLGMVTLNHWWSGRGLPVEGGRVVATAPLHQPCCGPPCTLLTVQITRPRPGWPARFEFSDCGRGGPALGDAVRVAWAPGRTVLNPDSLVEALLPPAGVLAGGTVIMTGLLVLQRRRLR